MTGIFQLNTSADFWLEIVVPDCSEYFNNKGNLRLALHAAISLFHMSDWVFHTHQATVVSGFTYINNAGVPANVSSASTFANSLEQQNADFGRIRGICHAAKHLKLHDIRPVANAPSHAANTASHAISTAAQGFFSQWWPSSPSRKVMLAGPSGNDMEFEAILRSVYEMWGNLKRSHGW